MFFEFLNFLIGKLTFFTGVIVGSQTFMKPLSKEQEVYYLKKAKEGDESAKEELVNHNMRLVAHIVKKYSGTAETDDLISVGSIGLIKAINTFEIEKGTSLATYTARCIENEILMLLRAGKKHKNDVSLLDPVGLDKDGNELTLMDVLCDEEQDVFDKVDRKIESERIVEKIKKILTKREFLVISLRFGLKTGRNYAQREVASFLHISRSYVSRIEKKAIEKLKISLKKSDFIDE